MSALKVLSLPTDAKPRIVAILEELLADAKAGKVTGLFVFHENDEGTVIHSRDGLNDSLVVFWLELIKRRILGGYEP